MLMVIPFAIMAVPAEWAAREEHPRGWGSEPAAYQRPQVWAPETQPANSTPNAPALRPSRSEAAPTPRGAQAVAHQPTATTAAPPDPYTAWVAANPVVRDADLSNGGTADGQAPQPPIVALRTQAITDLSAAGSAEGMPPTRRKAVGARLDNALDLSEAKPVAAVREAVAGVDLSKAGVLPGVAPKPPAVLGERSEKTMDLSRSGTAPGQAPRVPTRQDF